VSSLNGFGDELLPPGSVANVDWDYIFISQFPVRPVVNPFGSALHRLIGLARSKAQVK
jgi:hypothetical protein